jgi:4-hydroxybenzoate polyprenyltransferase
MKNRWWVYQQERFPIVRNSILVGILSLSAVSHSILLRSRQTESIFASPLIFLGTVIVAFLVVLLFFGQLQIVQEFQGIDQQGRYTLSRPVAEGMISLKELGIVAIAAGFVQLGLSVSLGWGRILPLVVLWGYIGLYYRQFFVARWLETRPFCKTAVQVFAVPIASFYVTACDWMTISLIPPNGLIWYLLVGFLSCLAIALAHLPVFNRSAAYRFKPSVQWGRQIAVRVWLGLVWAITLVTMLSALYARFAVPMALLLLPFLTTAIIVAWRFSINPNSHWAKWYEPIAYVWTLLVYWGLGPIALLSHL